MCLFSKETRDGMIATIASNPAAVRDAIDDLETSSAGLTAIMSVADRAATEILPDFLRGLGGAIAAEMAATAFDRTRALKVLAFLGIPESEIPETDSAIIEMGQNKRLRDLRAVSFALGKAEATAAAPFAWYFLLGGAIAKAQRLQSLMEAPVAAKALRKVGQGDVLSSDAEFGDAISVDAAREMADVMNLPLPEAGDSFETGAVPAVAAANLATSTTIGLIRAKRRKARRARRQRALAAALRHPAVEDTLTKSAYSEEPNEKEEAIRAANAIDSTNRPEPRRPAYARHERVQEEEEDDASPSTDRMADDGLLNNPD